MENAPQEKMFRRWVAIGQRFAALAAAGSVYLLIIIAARGHYKTIGLLQQPTIWVMCNTLRWPNPDTLIGQHILSQLIPLIDYVCQAIPLSIDTIFPPSWLQEVGLTQHINCQDFDLTVTFFDTFTYKCFRSVDCHHPSWAPCLISEDIMEMDEGPTSMYLMTRNLLFAASSTASTRLPSPIIDAKGELTGDAVDLQDTRLDRDPFPDAPSFRSEQFYTPDASSPQYLVLDTNFDLDTPMNKACPYPKKKKETSKWIRWSDQQRKYAENAYNATTLADFETKVKHHYSSDGVKVTNSYIRLDCSAFAGKEIQLNCKDGELLAFVAADMSQAMREGLERGLRSILFSGGLSEYQLQDVDTAASPGQHKFPCIHFSRYARNIVRGDDAPDDVHPLFLYKAKVVCGYMNHHQMIPYVWKEFFDHEQEYDALYNVFEEFFQWIADKLTHFNLHYRGERASLVLHSDRDSEDWDKDQKGWQHSTFMNS
ncbi:hypothetical protein SCP_0500610 [Sparassis crispa]|uniref:Uncharacterized protein n=1 Tax=Sparassis crispa TaxID=139825 RepID=A0A401GLG4_9APHY|nr:hypothetical protein SCP_0500610 [Sparassis crispa]GBE83018.1 hypothetical protein SCP_0500610 [Sparassis crispa]